MSSIRNGLLATIAGAAACLGMLACGDDTNSGGGGNASTTSATKSGTGNGNTASNGNTTGGNGNTTGANGTTTGGTVAGFCAATCSTPADCCQPGAPNCPSDMYPTNWTCDGGFCGSPQCATDADCTFGGVLPDHKCLTIDVGGNDLKACFEGCAVDADCTMGTTCIGEDSNGTKYCTVASTGGCMTDAECNGYGKCDTATGLCGCTGDADCTAPDTACND